MSDRHGAEKESVANALYQIAWAALVEAGLPRETRVQLVFDQMHINGNPTEVACFGSVNPDRLLQIVTDALKRQREMQADAVSALAKYTLGGTIRHPITGDDRNG